MTLPQERGYCPLPHAFTIALDGLVVMLAVKYRDDRSQDWLVHFVLRYIYDHYEDLVIDKVRQHDHPERESARLALS